jgi:hypothetical protein
MVPQDGGDRCLDVGELADDGAKLRRETAAREVPAQNEHISVVIHPGQVVAKRTAVLFATVNVPDGGNAHDAVRRAPLRKLRDV